MFSYLYGFRLLVLVNLPMIQYVCFLLSDLYFLLHVHHFCRLDDLILEAIKNLKEASGSNKGAIATYIEVMAAN
jgi:hypothetical protein